MRNDQCEPTALDAVWANLRNISFILVVPSGMNRPNPDSTHLAEKRTAGRIDRASLKLMTEAVLKKGCNIRKITIPRKRSARLPLRRPAMLEATSASIDDKQ
jgi:hypothetical protein